MIAAALVMGRAGSVSVAGKNIRTVAGHPLAHYPITAALAADRLDCVYVGTDCPVIAGLAAELGATVIPRPESLSGPDSEMSEVIVHAVQQMAPAPDVLVTMHANCGVHRPGLIDDCIKRLVDDPILDSCVSVRFVEDMHPYRLKRVRDDGTLTTWVDVPESTSNNRQQVADRAVVLDGAARAFRVSRCLPPNGQPPFRYLGHRIGFEENPGGLDVHCEADLEQTERWLKAQ